MAQDRDLFGLPITTYPPKPYTGGYAQPPGTGPAGETCGTCRHCYATQTRSGKRFYKCALVKQTSGPGTDIRLKTRSCRAWKPTEEA